MTLILTNQEQLQQVREDITFGKLTPPEGTELTLNEILNPNITYPNTIWAEIDKFDLTISGSVVTMKKWLRIA
jgi:hypothetical protein